MLFLLTYLLDIPEMRKLFSGLKRVPAGKVIKISSEGNENSYWKIPFPHSQKVLMKNTT